MRLFLPLLLHCCLTLAVSAQGDSARPKIGLTLSGGGAKGLAHIGILKAIDSAGLRIDYLTGTSMGSIIGSMYAVGYSADSIEMLARKINWEQLLTNQSSLRGIIMEEKEEYGRYAVELPWINHNFHLPSGVLEAEELWLKFSELLFPVYPVKDFSRFSIPFKCIGTDIVTGEAVVIDSGEIISAVRSSMAIPTVFTAVDYGGRRLVDGGVVRNFPVRDVIDMGADYTIGVNVSTGLLAADKISNALKVLMQITFFKEAEDSKKEIPLCNIYIPMPVEDYSAGSFGRSTQLLELGIEEGRKLYPRFKQLADSINSIFGPPGLPRQSLPRVDSVFISGYTVNGLRHTSETFFLDMMNFNTGRYYTASQLSARIRKTFGTRYYERIIYKLEPQPDGSAHIVFDGKENPLTTAKLSIHYNSYSGISLIANLTSRNLLTRNSRSLVTIDLGENFRIRGEQLEYFGKRKDFAAILGAQFENFKVTTYNASDEYSKDGLYKLSYLKFDGRVQHSTNRNLTMGVGLRYERINQNPQISSVLDIQGHVGFMNANVFIHRNTLDRTLFPLRGWKLDGELNFIFGQDGRVQFLEDGMKVLDTDSLDLLSHNYKRFLLKAEGYIPINTRAVLTGLIQTGMNFDYKSYYLNNYSVGGLTGQFRNQVLFAGLPENSAFSASVAAAQLGVRQLLFPNGYGMAKANILLKDFITEANTLVKPGFLSGYSLGFAYNFALGPLEVSAMYCDQSKRVLAYVNFGFAF